MPNGLVLQSGSWVVAPYTPTLPTGFMGDMYGVPIDGNLTVTGSATLTKESYYNNVTIATGSLRTAGCRLWVRGILTINSGCFVHDDGNNANSGTIGGTFSATRGFLGGQTGAAGAGVSVAGNGINAAVATAELHPLNSLGVTPSGGAGGNCGARTGGVGTAITAAAFGQNPVGNWLSGRQYTNTLTTGKTYGFAGGQGGSSGANDTGAAATSGAGGGGGGNVWIAANTIINNGRISANGGNGGNATGTGAAGGGGGGSGGTVIVITNTPSSSIGLIQSIGGAGGSPIGTGSVGSSGSVGGAYIISFGG
jgi:hypothetical protein